MLNKLNVFYNLVEISVNTNLNKINNRELQIINSTLSNLKIMSIDYNHCLRIVLLMFPKLNIKTESKSQIQALIDEFKSGIACQFILTDLQTELKQIYDFFQDKDIESKINTLSKDLAMCIKQYMMYDVNRIEKTPLTTFKFDNRQFNKIDTLLYVIYFIFVDRIFQSETLCTNMTRSILELTSSHYTSKKGGSSSTDTADLLMLSYALANGYSMGTTITPTAYLVNGSVHGQEVVTTGASTGGDQYLLIIIGGILYTMFVTICLSLETEKTGLTKLLYKGSCFLGLPPILFIIKWLFSSIRGPPDDIMKHVDNLKTMLNLFPFTQSKVIGDLLVSFLVDDKKDMMFETITKSRYYCNLILMSGFKIISNISEINNIKKANALKSDIHKLENLKYYLTLIAIMSYRNNIIKSISNLRKEKVSFLMFGKKTKYEFSETNVKKLLYLRTLGVKSLPLEKYIKEMESDIANIKDDDQKLELQKKLFINIESSYDDIVQKIMIHLNIDGKLEVLTLDAYRKRTKDNSISKYFANLSQFLGDHVNFRIKDIDIEYKLANSDVSTDKIRNNYTYLDESIFIIDDVTPEQYCVTQYMDDVKAKIAADFDYLVNNMSLNEKLIFIKINKSINEIKQEFKTDALYNVIITENSLSKQNTDKGINIIYIQTRSQKEKALEQAVKIKEANEAVLKAQERALSEREKIKDQQNAERAAKDMLEAQRVKANEAARRKKEIDAQLDLDKQEAARIQMEHDQLALVTRNADKEVARIQMEHDAELALVIQNAKEEAARKIIYNNMLDAQRFESEIQNVKSKILLDKTSGNINEWIKSIRLKDLHIEFICDKIKYHLIFELRNQVLLFKYNSTEYDCKIDLYRMDITYLKHLYITSTSNSNSCSNSQILLDIYFTGTNIHTYTCVKTHQIKLMFKNHMGLIHTQNGGSSNTKWMSLSRTIFYDGKQRSLYCNKACKGVWIKRMKTINTETKMVYEKVLTRK